VSSPTGIHSLWVTLAREPGEMQGNIPGPVDTGCRACMRRPSGPAPSAWSWAPCRAGRGQVPGARQALVRNFGRLGCHTGCCRIDPKIHLATCEPDVTVSPNILCGGPSDWPFRNSPHTSRLGPMILATRVVRPPGRTRGEQSGPHVAARPTKIRSCVTALTSPAIIAVMQ